MENLPRLKRPLVKIVHPWRIQTFSVNVCLLLLWKTIRGMFNFLSIMHDELSYKLCSSDADAGILSLGCRTVDIGLLSV